MLDSIHFYDRQEVLDKLESYCAEDGVLLICSVSLLKKLDLTELSFIKGVTFLGSVSPNPTIANVFDSLNAIKGKRFKSIVAIGGGSCIDLAKAISSIYYMVGNLDEFSFADIRDIIVNKTYVCHDDYIDIVAVPTTAGTGSEVTKWATIWDMDNFLKFSIESPLLYPKEVMIVPEFTLNLPQRLTLSTGLDALSHAMESFWAKSRNCLSQELALLAIKKICKFLPLAVDDGSNLLYRSEMCKASLLAGLAFSTTKTTACHSISYPLTMRFGLEHGFAAFLSISSVARRNIVAVPEIALIYDIFGGMEDFQRWVEVLCQNITSLKLPEFGISYDDIDMIARETFTQGRMDNNPILFSVEDVKEILLEAMDS